MTGLQWICGGILIATAAGVARRGVLGAWPRLGARLLLMALALWLLEDIAARLLPLHNYGPGWGVMLDRVPLLVVLIWPVVILSAMEICAAIAPDRRAGHLALMTGLLVLADAAVIEPVAFQAGLWAYVESGPFGVPLAVLIGRGLFAGLCVWSLARAELGGGKVQEGIALIPVAVLGTGLGVLAVQRVGLGGFTEPWPEGWLVLTAFVLAFAATVWLAATGVGAQLGRGPLLGRLPGAILLAVLIVIYGRYRTPLVAWSCAFLPPWLALALARRPRPRAHPST